MCQKAKQRGRQETQYSFKNCAIIYHWKASEFKISSFLKFMVSFVLN